MLRQILSYDGEKKMELDKRVSLGVNHKAFNWLLARQSFLCSTVEHGTIVDMVAGTRTIIGFDVAWQLHNALREELGDEQ